MKILLLVVTVLALLVLTIVVMGSLLPKRHLASRSAVYRATPEQLFALIVGPQTWRPDLRHAESLPSGDGGELIRETSRNGDVITYEVLEKKAPVSLKRRIATEKLPYSGTWTYEIQSNAQGTTVRITEDGEVYNPVFRFLSRFVFGHTSTMDGYLRALGNATGQEVVVGN